MTTAVSTLLGRPVWYELMTTDPAAAEKFYKNVVGWSSTPFEGSSEPYTVFKRSGDVQVAGLMKTPDGMNLPPFWSMYIAVPKLEEAVAHIKRLGGTEMSEVIDIPSIGRLQMLRDPQGAAFYIIQPAPREERAETPAEIGEASWHELTTTDAEAAMRFYSEVFGWQPTEVMDMGEMGKYRFIQNRGTTIGAVMPKPAQLPVSMWTYYIGVDDIDRALDAIKAGGGQLLNGPMEIPGGEFAVNAMDPQGASFGLVGPRK